MRAIHIKNSSWGYADGSKVKPEVTEGDDTTQQAAERCGWRKIL